MSKISCEVIKIHSNKMISSLLIIYRPWNQNSNYCEAIKLCHRVCHKGETLFAAPPTWQSPFYPVLKAGFLGIGPVQAHRAQRSEGPYTWLNALLSQA